MRNHNYLDLLLEVTCSACDQTYFFSFTLFDWLIIKKVLKVWKFPQNANSKLYIYIIYIYTYMPILNLLYRFKENNIWAKYMGQSEKLLGAYWGTHWELKKHVKNAMRTGWEHIGNQKIQYPARSPKEEKLVLFGVCCNLSLADSKYCYTFSGLALGFWIIILYFKIHFDNLKKIVNENLAINRGGSFFGSKLCIFNIMRPLITIFISFCCNIGR